MQSQNERIDELIKANNRLVSERNAALAEVEHYKGSVDFLLRHNGMQEMRRLSEENQRLTKERDDALHAQRELDAQVGILGDRLEQAEPDKVIVAAARKWALSIHTLRRAMKPNESGKKGNVLGPNQAYTAAQLAMLSIMPDTPDK